MSTVIVLAPIIIGSWPAITAAVTAAVGTLGFATVRGVEGVHRKTDTKVREEIEVDNSEILQAAAGAGEELVVEREGLRAIFTRDARGTLKVCMEGVGYTKPQLRQIGQELIDRVTQQYVYHRIVTELQAKNMNIVEEEVTEDRTVKIRVRSW